MKILLSAGHGGTDSGSIGADGGKEKDRTINLANKVANYLRNAGHSVTVKQEKNSSGDFYMKNRSGYDFALSIHFNAFDGAATGTECLYKGTKKKADILSSAVANAIGVRNRGAKSRPNLYMLNIGFDNLIEVCFHDNSSDLNKYNANIDKVAKAIADTINGGSTGGSTSSGSNNNSTSSSYNGNSIVDYLKSVGQDSSFSNRKKLAQAHGISNYKGTASQNTQLLNILRSNKSSGSSTSYYAKYSGSSSSIVDALKSIGVDSSYSNREKIAKANGISNYSGTASQNIKLLNLLKQGKLKK